MGKGGFDKCKAVVFDACRKASVRQIRLSDVDDESIVVKTVYSGISSGTEMAVYNGEACGEGVCYPCVPGYENVGVVVHVGRNAPVDAAGRPFKEGDRVMSNEVRHFPDYNAAWGGQCELAVKSKLTSPFPPDAIARIPDNVSWQEAVVAYLACVAKKGIDMVDVKAGESVLVIGQGCVGLSAVQLAKFRGAGNVIAADIRDCRLSLPRRYADHVLNISGPDAKAAVMALNGGRQVDVVIECSGNPDAVSPLADYVRPGGRVHLQGQYRKPIIVTDYARWNCSDLRISCSIALNRGGKEEVLDLISKGLFDAKSLYSLERSVDDAPAAYKELAADRYGILKTILRWE